MPSEIVVAMYRPKSGKEEALELLVRRHHPMLVKLGLVTDRPVTLLKSGDGTLMEIFEWVSAEAARQAHEQPTVGELWGAMEAIAEFVTLADLPEATTRFPHFGVVA